MLSLSSDSQPRAAIGNEIFIPVAALPGITAAELANGIPLETRTSKITLAVLEQVFSYLSVANNDKLGFSATKGNPVGSGNNRITQNYTVTSQLLADARNGEIGNLPTPGSGAGGFSLADVFPGAAKFADGENMGIGVSFGLPRLLDLRNLSGDDTTINGNSDNRALLDVLLFHLAKDRELRTASVESGVINSSVSAFTASSIPNTFNAQNSGIDLSNTDSLAILQRSYSLTLELELDQSTQTFDVRVATA